jgi:hypothetical protein
MDPHRRAELLKSLKELLEDETRGRDRTARLAWLFDHLEEYLERWSGWLALDTMTMGGILDNDLHVCLVVTIGLIDQEYAPLVASPAFQTKWSDFVSTVRQLDANTCKDTIVETLQGKFLDAYKELPKTSRDKP